MDNETNTTQEPKTSYDQFLNGEVVTLPMWRKCLDDMEDNLAFEAVWPAEFFEDHFKCRRTETAFTWEMIELRQHLELEYGYYLKSERDGESFRIPSAFEHEDVAVGFERKMKRFARRSITLRASVLVNPDSRLTDDERRIMDANMERAAHRYLLITRSRAIADPTANHPQLDMGKRSTTGQ